MPWMGRVLQQSHAQSCGYCCAGMVVNEMESGHCQLSESSLVAAGKRLDPSAYDRAAKDRVGASMTPLVRAAYEQRGQLPHWGSGTYGNHLADVLGNYQIAATYHQGDVKTAMRTVVPGKPLIVLVQWHGGGGHWVVVVGRNRHFGRASDYRILDPAGHEFDNKGSTTYDPPYNATGRFANYYVSVTGRIAAAPRKVGVKLPGM